MTTPVEELRAAATKLRETAAKATPGPWSASPVWSPRSHVTSAVYSHAHATGTAESEVIPSMLATPKRALVRPGDAAWIALASPALAEPIAAGLEACAHDLEGAERTASKWPGDFGDPLDLCDEPNSVRRALAVARRINGGTR